MALQRTLQDTQTFINTLEKKIEEKDAKIETLNAAFMTLLDVHSALKVTHDEYVRKHKNDVDRIPTLQETPNKEGNETIPTTQGERGESIASNHTIPTRHRNKGTGTAFTHIIPTPPRHYDEEDNEEMAPSRHIGEVSLYVHFLFVCVCVC